MPLEFLTNKLEKNSDFVSLKEQILDGKNEVFINASRLIRPFILASLLKYLKGKEILMVLPNENSCETWQRNLTSFGIESLIFPAWESLPTDRISPSAHVVSERMKALQSLKERGVVILVPARAAILPVVPQKDKRYLPIKIQPHTELPMSSLLNQLIDYGYERVLKVEQEGHFAVRGGIVDIFAPTFDVPARIEFFGDEIDSVRFFDPVSQLSIKHTDKVEIFAVREFRVTEERKERSCELLGELYDKDWLQEDIDKLANGQSFDGMEAYLPFFEDETSYVFDYLRNDAVLILDEKDRLIGESHALATAETVFAKETFDSGLLPEPPISIIKSLEDSIDALSNPESRIISFSAFKKEHEETLDFTAADLPVGILKESVLKKTVNEFLAGEYDVVFMLKEPGTMERLHEHLLALGFNYVAMLDREKPSQKSKIFLVLGDVEGGFSIPSIKLAVITGSDMFKKHSHKEPPQFFPVKGSRVYQLSDLEVGDYVVHRTHGIGRYGGLTYQTLNSTTGEYLIIEYAQGDKLYIPATNLDRVAKYIGSTEVPRLTRLGTTDWSKAKQKVKKSLKKLAFDLLTLYSERMKNRGHVFSPDAPWQKELEDNFPYQETSDQERAITDVKKDMESPKPMDRLVCGDVGYGKTEVAVRASFKAVMDNKQVMVLVPTTLLAQQHYSTIKERVEPFPVRVEMLSRFLTRSKQKIILDDFSKGSVDILVGTHRLIQKDVIPKDLGLLVIDEEHRFGVGHKEKIKDMRKDVDVLTLTATPIPRTLQMSLSGIRGLSLMETPPVGRQPVITFVGQYNIDLCKAAIRRELARNGQVFYVHNRVQDIYAVLEKIKSAVPEARIDIAHGQMNELQLQRTMERFLRGEIDVLICTSIIESGIDIPNANTLIVESSDRFGLAQLYHLKGRVGRSHRRGYAYFFISNQLLKSGAYERLQTIGELTQLGSGMKVALKDLELRGAGNMLGPEQHGSIAAVGFDMYVSMLDSAVKEMRGQPEIRKSEVKINLPVNALIPEGYIADEVLRIEAYRILSEITNKSDAKNALATLEDRYGKPMKEVRELIKICVIKALAETVGIQKILYAKNKISVSPLNFDDDLMTEIGKAVKVNYKQSEKAYELFTEKQNALAMLTAFLKAVKDKSQKF